MPVSESKKRANKKWNEANTKLFTARLRNSDFEAVEAERKKQGKSRADVVREWLQSQHEPRR